MTTIDWTKFALDRHSGPHGHTWFNGPPAMLVETVHAHWKKRVPGFGRSNLDEVVVVDVPPTFFVGTTATIRDGVQLVAEVARRRPHEDPYVRVTARCAPDAVTYARVVLYHRELLLTDGEPNFTADWGIVSLIASSTPNEPMHPLTMARNMLEKPGGTRARYTAEQFAEAIYYWSDRVSTASA